MTIIKISRGLKSGMPVLQDGQQYFCTDTKEIFIGDKGVNKNINKSIEVIYQMSFTHAELTAMSISGSLIPGMQYLLTDYVTKYQQPISWVIKTADTGERLVLTAISTSQFDRQCSSLDFPQDLVWYDFNNIKCEDNVTPRPGFILRRHDRFLNINCPHDWRTILWARYRVDPTGIVEWTSGMNVTEGTLYILGNKIVIATRTGKPSSISDGVYFGITVLDSYKTNYCMPDSDFGRYRLTALKTDLKEMLTFQDLVMAHNIFIDDYFSGPDMRLSNNTFGDYCQNNTFGANCYNNTFGDFCQNNTFGPYCHNNFFAGTAYQNIFEPTCFRNTFGPNCQSNNFASGYRYNIITGEFSDNSFESNCQSNNFGNNYRYNIIGPSHQRNIWEVDCLRNSVGARCVENSFGASAQNNTIMTECQKNTFDSFFKNNILGTMCSANTFGPNCSNNILGSYFVNNTLGNGSIQITSDPSTLNNKVLTAIVDMTEHFHKTITRNASGIPVYMKLDANNVPVYTVIP